MIPKLDFKKEIEAYRAPRGTFQQLAVPPLQYLMLDGQGDPNSSPAFTQAIETLYPVAYKLKFLSKVELERDYVVMPLEGLWWAEDMRAFTSRRDKSAWNWTLMIMVPGWIQAQHFAEACRRAAAKKPLPGLDQIRLQWLEEGSCVQTLHVGSFDDEGTVLARMHSEVGNAGLQLTGRHHEIYLSDFRHTAPQKLRTILRQPVRAA